MTKNNSNLAFPNEKGNSSITLESLPKYKIKNKALMKISVDATYFDTI